MDSTRKQFSKQEVWRDVDGHSDLYRISSLGRVKSFHNKKSRIMKPSLSTGYLLLGLSKNRKIKHSLIHRLVGAAFIQNPENKPMINHKNGIKKDNRVENLEWVTAKENIKHAVNAGLNKGPVGEKQWLSKLIYKDVLKIRKLHDTGKYSQKEIGNMFFVSKTTINNVIKKRTWKHI